VIIEQVHCKQRGTGVTGRMQLAQQRSAALIGAWNVRIGAAGVGI
jgi:hypothetical protein